MSHSSQTSRSTLIPLAALIALTLLLASGPRATSAVGPLVVASLSDSGAGSLRDAITTANTQAGADTITFSVSGTIILLTSLPDVTDAADLTIDGTGATVTVSGSNSVRMIAVISGKSLTLKALTVANGRNTVDGQAGGIRTTAR